MTKTLFIFIFLLVHYSVYSGSSKNEIIIKRFLNPVKIDGYLTEPDWKQAAKISDFYNFRPVDGKPAAEQTAVFLGYSRTSLYIAVISFDPSPSKIRASITKRDEIFDDDFIIIYLDTFNDGKNAYQFAFNPFGIQADGIFIEAVGEDFNPDYIFYSKGRYFKKGYILEIEIPFKSLRFPTNENLTWGMSVMRRINHLDKDIIWPAISRNLSTFVPQFAKINGISHISPGNNIEILPEVTSHQQGNINPDNHKFEEGFLKYEGGLNLKYGVTSNFTIDAAYNPDFSQIEADANKIDVNKRYPLKYDEKRPFFLESTSVFETPIRAVYTRSIVDPLIGIKATGQIGDYSIGILGGIDDYSGSKQYLDDVSKYQSYYDPTFDKQRFLKKYIYEESYFGVFRLKKNIWDYSSIGLLVTERQQRDIFSRTYGVDGRFIITNQYIFTFQALHSQSKNFFETKEKEDPAFHASLYHRTRTFSFQLFYNDVYPKFEAANGFLERTDTRQLGSYIWYDFLSEKSFISMFRPNLYSYQIYDHENNKIDEIISPALTFETKGNTELTLSYLRIFEEYAGYKFDKNQYMLSLTNKTLPWLILNNELVTGEGVYYYGNPPFKGYVHNIISSIELKPTRQWSNEFKVSNYLFHGWQNSQKTRVHQDIYRFKTTYQFTRSLFLRLIIEHNNNNFIFSNHKKDLNFNFLLSYQLIPGTVMFLGYNDNFVENSNRDYKRYARGLFTKFSYLFRF